MCWCPRPCPWLPDSQWRQPFRESATARLTGDGGKPPTHTQFRWRGPRPRFQTLLPPAAAAAAARAALASTAAAGRTSLGRGPATVFPGAAGTVTADPRRGFGAGIIPAGTGLRPRCDPRRLPRLIAAGIGSGLHAAGPLPAAPGGGTGIPDPGPAPPGFDRLDGTAGRVPGRRRTADPAHRAGRPCSAGSRGSTHPGGGFDRPEGGFFHAVARDMAIVAATPGSRIPGRNAWFADPQAGLQVPPAGIDHYRACTDDGRLPAEAAPGHGGSPSAHGGGPGP